MTCSFIGTVVRDMIVMRRHRGLEQPPSLVDANRSDEIGSDRTSIVAGAKRAEGVSRNATWTNADILDTSLIVGGRILRRNRRRNAIAEPERIGKLVDANDRAAAADETVEDIAGISRPGHAER